MSSSATEKKRREIEKYSIRIALPVR